jgi:hypothetical protein
MKEETVMNSIFSFLGPQDRAGRDYRRMDSLCTFLFLQRKDEGCTGIIYTSLREEVSDHIFEVQLSPISLSQLSSTSRRDDPVPILYPVRARVERFTHER